MRDSEDKRAHASIRRLLLSKTLKRLLRSSFDDLLPPILRASSGVRISIHRLEQPLLSLRACVARVHVCLRSKDCQHLALCAATFHVALATFESHIVNSVSTDNSLRRATLKTHVRDCYCRELKHFVLSPNSFKIK